MYQPLGLFGFSLSTLFNWSNLYRMPASQIDWNVFYYYVRWGSGVAGPPGWPWPVTMGLSSSHSRGKQQSSHVSSASISISLYLYGISLWKLDLTVRKLLSVHPISHQHQTDNWCCCQERRCYSLKLLKCQCQWCTWHRDLPKMNYIFNSKKLMWDYSEIIQNQFISARLYFNGFRIRKFAN